MKLFLTGVAILFVVGCSDQSDVFQLARHYQPGEAFAYEMITRTVHNGSLRGVETVRSKHTVNDTEPLSETVRWESFTIITGETEEDHSEVAASVEPYKLSLDPSGSLDLPKITVPEMTGAITDLHTFYVAASEKLGGGHLKTDRRRL